MKKSIWTVLMATLIVGLIGMSFADMNSKLELGTNEANIELEIAKVDTEDQDVEMTGASNIDMDKEEDDTQGTSVEESTEVLLSVNSADSSGREVSSYGSTIGNLMQTTYKKGTTQLDVKTIQQALDAEGFFDHDEYTAYYGDITEEGVKAFQTEYGIESDGIVGTETIDKFVELGYVDNNVSISRAGSRVGSTKLYGNPISWYDVRDTFDRQESILLIEDFYTGVTFQVMMTYGSNHLDIETLTVEDTETVKALWGGEFNWERRPVLVHFEGNVYAASMNGMPHAGLDSQPEGEWVDGRSAGFGYGYNFDAVKGNGIDGHFCLHFKDSKLHTKDKVDSRHQEAVMIAAGL